MTASRRTDERHLAEFDVVAARPIDLVDRALPVALERSPRLATSADASVVFASLAARCVPEFCDDCVIDLHNDAGDGIAGTAASTGDAPDRTVASSAVRRVTVAFGCPSAAASADTVEHDHAATVAPFRGSVSFTWADRAPTRGDRATADALVDLAVRTVLWQHSEDAARAASTRAENLKIALQTSRQIGAAIGILMSQHKITQERAFELLRLVSQHGNRKLRDLALDVVETGSLDPALARRSLKPGA